MLQPKKWWIGLPLLAGLVYFASDQLTRTIEPDLSTRVAARLPKAVGVIDNPRVEALGRDVTISGLALSQDEKNRAVASARGEEGLRSLLDKTQAVGVAQPYLFSIERKGSAATMSGYAPPGGEREKLRNLIAAASLEVTDNTSYAAGAPARLVDAAAAGVEAMNRLPNAKLAFVGGDISLDGEAPYEKAIPDIEHRFLSAVPQGFRVVTHLKAPVVGAALEPAQCQSAFEALLAKRRIQFADKSARLLDESAPLIGRAGGCDASLPDRDNRSLRPHGKIRHRGNQSRTRQAARPSRYRLARRRGGRRLEVDRCRPRQRLPDRAQRQ